MPIISMNPENKASYLPQVREIFFLCSAIKTFESEEQKEAFFSRWTDYYLNFTAQTEVLLAIDDEDQLLGYLMGCANSLEALDFYERRIPSYSLFSDLFKEFPCHLHINAHPKSQGQGVGTALVQAYKDSLKSQGYRGLHIVTSEGEQNASFYKRCGFEIVAKRRWKDIPLLFMACRI